MISVVVTCYNKAEYIEECIRSVMEQTYRDLEIIVVDDGSTDGSRDIISRLAEKDDRILPVVTGESGGGAANARNEGLRLAKGEWMFFLDGDDWILPYHLERLWLRARNKAIDVPCSQYVWVTPDEEHWSPPVGPTLGGRMFELSVTGCPLCIHGAIIRRSLALDVGGFSSGYEPAEDWDFWSRVARTGAQFDFVVDTLAPYRLSPTSVQKAKLEALLKNSYRILEEGAVPDPRVRSHLDFAGGHGQDYIPLNKLFTWSYAAAIAMGSGVPLDELPAPVDCPKTSQDAFGLAQMLYLDVPFGLSRLPDVWQEIWPSWRSRIRHAFELMNSPLSMMYFEALVKIPWPEVVLGVSPRDWLEDTFMGEEDPWCYRTSPYELRKYEQTMELLPEAALSAAEIGCAEGVFTEQLAGRVGSLDAFDISPTALARARERCKGLSNVWFHLLDVYNEPLPDKYDLIVCSEVLYHVDRPELLWGIADKFFHALKEDGDLVMAHARLVTDNRERPAFYWEDCYFGAETIARVFGNRFSLVQEIVTPFYRVQRYRKNLTSVGSTVVLSQCGEMTDELAASIVEGADQYVPVLAYHGLNRNRYYQQRWTLAVERFREQMAYLAEHGYQAVHVKRFLDGELPEKPVILTFDDAEESFCELAWPILQEYGFVATVFVPVASMDGYTDWAYGPQSRVLGKREIRRLSAEGVQFGAHGLYHAEVVDRWAEAVICETLAARALLEDVLRQPVDLYAYPYGLSDFRARAVVKACGFRAAFEADDLLPRSASRYDNLMALPRIPITGQDTLADFVGRLAS